MNAKASYMPISHKRVIAIKLLKGFINFYFFYVPSFFIGMTL